jgi:dephospho-CoA kinase
MTRRIALTGGIASGKSTVAQMFADMGALILDADKAAREVVRPSSPCWRKLKELLGEDYFTADGQLKRREVRDLIIRDDRYRNQVNAILHPAINEAMESEWEKARTSQPGRPVIFDIPLLFEVHLEGRFDTVILAYVPPEVQIERLAARDGVSRPNAERALTMQLPIESKKARSHFIIDNSLDLANTRRQVEAVWRKLLA